LSLFFFLPTTNSNLFLENVNQKKKNIAVYISRIWSIRSYQEVAYLFNAPHPDYNPISKFIVQKTVTHFFEAKTVKDRPRSGKAKSATNDDKNLDILQSFQENPSEKKEVRINLSVSRAAHDISQDSVFNILKRNITLIKYHPYKIIIVQDLIEDDFDRRIQFSFVKK